MSLYAAMVSALSDGLTAEPESKVIITTDDELFDFVERTWGVKIPNVQVCPHHSTPARAFADAYFARSSVTIWEASRGFGGKSFLLALLAVTEAVTLAVDVNVLGGSGEQSKRVLEHMTRFWNEPTAPRELLASDPSSRKVTLTSNARIQALMASQRSVRGGHPVRLRCDEVDEMSLPILDAAMGQTMSMNGVAAQTVLSSTRQYADGTMTEMLRRAAENGYAVHSWCYHESLEPHGWLLHSEVDRKRKEVTQAMWDAEYELQEPSPDTRAIQPQAVEDMFKSELGEFAGNLHEYIEVEPPVSGAKYSTGADWARKRDFTEIITFRTDVRPVRLVAYLKTHRLDWPVMVGYYNERVNRYPGSAFHDATGIGDVISSYLTCNAEDVIMVGRGRADMLTNYISAIENREMVAPLIRSLKAEHQFASFEDVFGSGESHHLPDGMSAGALAWKGIKYAGPTDEELNRYANGNIDPSKLSPAMILALQQAGIDIQSLLKG